MAKKENYIILKPKEGTVIYKNTPDYNSKKDKGFKVLGYAKDISEAIEKCNKQNKKK